MARELRRLLELTQPTRGSARIGIIDNPDDLWLFVGPAPEVYNIGVIAETKGKHRLTVKLAATQAQDILTSIYDMPKEIRGHRWPNVVEYIQMALGLKGETSG